MVLLTNQIIDLCLPHHCQTIHANYIYCLANIVSLRKAAVVSIEKSEDILMWPLIGLVYLYAKLNEL